MQIAEITFIVLILITLSDILQLFLLFFSNNLMSLPNLATLIPNLQSEFTHHVTLFCKIEFKFYSKTHVISQISTHFCSIAQ